MGAMGSPKISKKGCSIEMRFSIKVRGGVGQKGRNLVKRGDA